MKHWVKGGHNYYYNLNTKEGTWVEPESFVQNNTQLNKEDIQVGSCTCAAVAHQCPLLDECGAAFPV